MIVEMFDDEISGVFGGVKPEVVARWYKLIVLLSDGRPRNANQIITQLALPRRTLERDISALKSARALGVIVTFLHSMVLV